MSKGHVHAELMAQYAQDALETDRPWERWQSRSKGAAHDNMAWRTMYGHPKWQGSRDYRRKPVQVQVAGEVFDDIVLDRDACRNASVFLVMDSIVYQRSPGDVLTTRYREGLVHTTYDGAYRHLEALKPTVL